MWISTLSVLCIRQTTSDVLFLLFAWRYVLFRVSLNVIPASPPYNPQVMKTWHKLCHLPSSPLPSSICHGSLRTGLVCVHIPRPFSPSTYVLHACPFWLPTHPWHTGSSIPACLWKDLLSSLYSNHYLLTFLSLPMKDKSVSESLERYLWCCQNDSSGRRVVSPFVLFICRMSYSYQLWRLLHARKYHH